MESPDLSPGIEYDYLWMAFRPGELVYQRVNGIDRVVKLVSMEKDNFGSWGLSVQKFAYDGNTYGHRSETIRVSWYEGYKPLEQLRAYPLNFHPEAKEIRRKPIARGRRYLELCRARHLFYSGAAESLAPSLVNAEEEYYTIEGLQYVL